MQVPLGSYPRRGGHWLRYDPTFSIFAVATLYAQSTHLDLKGHALTTCALAHSLAFDTTSISSFVDFMNFLNLRF